MTERRAARSRAAVPLLAIAALVGSVGSCARRGDAPPAPPPSDDAVYAAVVRQHFLRPRRPEGDLGLLCDPEAPGGRLAIVGRTQRLPPGTPARDSGWTAHMPAPAAPLMAALRALDRQPARALDADSLAAVAPIQLVPDSLAARAFRPLGKLGKDATRPQPIAPPLHWFSRVAYTADGRWALVYAVKVCPGITEAEAAEAENGAYETAILAPLEWRAGGWTLHPPVFLDVGLPRLAPD